MSGKRFHGSRLLIDVNEPIAVEHSSVSIKCIVLQDSLLGYGDQIFCWNVNTILESVRNLGYALETHFMNVRYLNT